MTPSKGPWDQPEFPVLEPRDLFRSDGKRPDGKTLIPWSQGKPFVWDVTVVDTVADSYLLASSRTAGAAAELAESKKSAKYTNLGQHHIFVPIAFETFGTWRNEADKVVSEIGNKIADCSGEPRALEFLRQRISVQLQRGNAISVLGTLNDYKCFDKIFFC